ncbi:protein of unknown function [Nocardia cyriacigeorgica GUH-2]|uniref:Uncharacterized protein n=1 Tax=Nocardia cyriacigeorgica (strain GUH-2) TaxID=1127134 RepID=H6QZW8_NOCCG|nr:protein of unknown function [Nocardia cyriacigeorgica GUH-2]
MLGGSGTAQARSPADLQVQAGCGYPTNHTVVVRNQGPAPAYDVTVRYWSAFGPVGEHHVPIIEPGYAAVYDLGPMRTLELAAVTATSRTPDAVPGNNQGIFPTLYLPSTRCPASCEERPGHGLVRRPSAPDLVLTRAPSTLERLPGHLCARMRSVCGWSGRCELIRSARVDRTSRIAVGPRSVS